MKLHDGGTRLAARVASLQASLQSQVTQLRALLPSSAGNIPASKLSGDKLPQSAPKESAATIPAGNDSGKQAASGPLTAAPPAKPPTPTKTVASSQTPMVSSWGCDLLISFMARPAPLCPLLLLHSWAQTLPRMVGHMASARVSGLVSFATSGTGCRVLWACHTWHHMFWNFTSNIAISWWDEHQ